MAGHIGRVANNSNIPSSVISNWEPWMTEVVILHSSGVSIPELRVQFKKPDRFLRVVVAAEQAKEIYSRISKRAISEAMDTFDERLFAVKTLALDNIVDALTDEKMKEKNPFAFWDASRKSLETVSRLEDNKTVVQNNTQNNFVNISSSELDKLRNTPTLKELPAAFHVDYLGPPPPPDRGEEKAILGSGVSTPASKSEDGPALSLSGRPANGREYEE